LENLQTILGPMAFAAAGMSYDKLPMTHTKIVAAM
jgi:hypothetical protein